MDTFKNDPPREVVDELYDSVAIQEENVVEKGEAITDVVINVASSIAIEALIQQRPIIYPFYLHGNKTIFDTPELVNLASGYEEVISLLNNHYKGNKLFLPNKKYLRQFFINEVYGGNESNDVLKTYFDHIVNCKSY